MNKQHTHDRLCSFKEMKKQISFYLFSTKRLSWEQTDWKTNKKKALDQMFRIRWGSPNPGLIFKLFFPPRGKKIKKTVQHFYKKKKKKKNQKVRVRSVNFPYGVSRFQRDLAQSASRSEGEERCCEWKCGRRLRATGPELVGSSGRQRLSRHLGPEATCEWRQSMQAWHDPPEDGSAGKPQSWS